MGIKRVVNVDFWNDDVVAEKYTPEDRYFFLYLLTNPNTTQSGIYHLPIRTIAFETGYAEDEVENLLNKFQKEYKNIIYSYKTNEIAILNFLKHSIIKGGKPVEDCLRKEMEEVKDKTLIHKVYEHIIDYMNLQINLKAKNGSKSMYVGIKNVLSDILEINNNEVVVEFAEKQIGYKNYEQRKNINYEKFYANKK